MRSPSLVRTSSLTRRSPSAASLRTSPRSSSRSTMPVTFELSQKSAWASSLILRGPAPSIRRAIICCGARSNSWAIANIRCLLVTIIQCIRLQAWLPGSVRPSSPASQDSGPRPRPFSESFALAMLEEMLPGKFATYKVARFNYLCILPSFFATNQPGGGIRMSSRNGIQSHANGIEVNGLVREFKGSVRAVDGIDLEVRPGEIYGFLGPNGAGKSTTVHMLTTLLPPTAGSARVAGFDVITEGASVRDAIGAALQEAALDPNLTAREHMRLQGALHGMPKPERIKRGNELIDRVGLSNAADRKVGGYSGGMKRRLDLALALLHGPRVLFLDEPTTGLDIQSRTALWDEVQRLVADRGVTVFLTTQYLEEADILARRIGIIDHGQIVAEGTPKELKAQIGRPSVEAIPSNPEDLPQVSAVLQRFGEREPGTPQGATVRLSGADASLASVVRALDAEDLEVEHLELHQPSLSDVFLAKTGRSLEGAGEEPEEEPAEAVAA